MPALAFALPAAAAAFAYFNARHGISYDASLVSAAIRSAVSGALDERRDTLNLFYQLEAHATSSHSDHPWIIFQGRTWTYAQACDIVRRHGAWLKSQGVEKDEVVAIDFVNSESFIWVWFGLWSIGAKPAFINYNLVGAALVHSIETSTARLVLVDEAGRDKLNEEMLKKYGFTRLQEEKYSFKTNTNAAPLSVRNLTRTPRALEPAKGEAKVRQRFQIIHYNAALESHILSIPPIRLLNRARADQTRSSMAILIYTSGTTGLPKPAVMSWNKCNVGSRLMSSWLGLTTDDVIYTSMPLYHSSASVLGVCAALSAGSTICLSARFSHKTFWPEVRSSNATIIHYVGETCRYLLSASPSPLDHKNRLRAAFGNGLRPDVWESFKKRFNIPTIYEFYAATEAPGALFNRSSNGFSSGAIGRNGTLADFLFSSGFCLVRIDTTTSPPAPLRSTTSKLCLLATPNEQGELLFRLDPHNIPQKFQGYFNNPSATNSKIIRNVKKHGDAWYRSGDLMRKDSDGRWWWVDRVGDTFRWKSENCSASEIADVLGKHDAVQEACVYGVQVPGYDGRAGCAAVVLKKGVAIDATMNALAKHVEKELPSYARPVWVRVTKEMQITGTNKHMKHVLQDEGTNPVIVEEKGDVLFWLRDANYVRFGKRDWERVQGGGVKL